MAMLAILVSDRKLIRNMNKTRHYARLLKRLYWTAGYYAATMFLSLFSLFLSGKILTLFAALSTGLMVGPHTVSCSPVIGCG